MKMYGQAEKMQLENTTSDTASHPAGMITYRTDLNVPKVSNGATYKDVVIADLAQSLSSKILVSPEVNGSILFDEIATPSNPAANEHKVYFKSDGNLYALDSTGAETPVGSGGGGGGGAVWRADTGAPEATYENGELVYTFIKDLSQSIYLFIRVPSSYIAGRQITLYLGAYTSATSNVFRMRIDATLIQKNTDAITDATDSVNVNSGDITNTVANQYRELSIDISDASGQINGTAVAPGDLIKMYLTRTTPVGTDCTEDIKVLPNATEITFS